VAVDPSGEVVAAGSLDSFEIHLWSVQTGQLLDRLSGHEGPISSIAFTPDGSSLVSGSWDHTVRIWSVFARTQTSEPLQLQADVLQVIVRPDSQQVAISTLDGQLTFWSIAEAIQQGGLDARRDVSGGRKTSDRRTAANVAGTKAFRSIAYSADGSVVVAGGNSKYICLYDVESGVLLYKYTVSVNLSLDGTQEYLNSKALTEAGPEGLLDTRGENSDVEDRLDKSLPGAKKGDAGQRQHVAEVRVSDIAFAPTGRSFCAASTEGLLIYSIDSTLSFDPFDLDVTITPESVVETLEKGEYLQALVMSFRLNDNNLVTKVCRGVPVADVALVVRDLPQVYIDRLLRHVSTQTDQSPFLELNLIWLKAIIQAHGALLKKRQLDYTDVVRMTQKAVGRMSKEIIDLADNNEHKVEFLLSQPTSLVNGNGDDLDVKMLTNGSLTNDMEMEMEDEDNEGEWIGLE